VIWLSALLVFGTTGVVLFLLGSETPELVPGYRQLIHARVPWILLGLLWGGGALGLAALLRRFRAVKLGVLLLELPLIGLASWYFLAGSYLPPHEALKVSPGMPFPAYALPDQDGKVRRFEPAAAEGPALYIFYRGDW
jgi:hypothetical protein